MVLSIFVKCQYSLIGRNRMFAYIWFRRFVFYWYICFSLCTKFCGLIEPTNTTKIVLKKQKWIISILCKCNTLKYPRWILITKCILSVKSYGVYLFQLILYSRACGSYHGFQGSYWSKAKFGSFGKSICSFLFT